jgi:hypothetical protein
MHIFNSLPAAIVAVAFWAFLAVCAVAGMRYDFRKRQLAMDSLRAAIERGQTLEPGLVAQLLAQHRGPEADGPGDLEPYLRIGGIITIAAGIGVLIAAFFVGLQFPVAKLPMLGASALAVCVGLGLLLAAGAVGRHRRGGGSPDSVA